MLIDEVVVSGGYVVGEDSVVCESVKSLRGGFSEFLVFGVEPVVCICVDTGFEEVLSDDVPANTCRAASC